MTIEFKCIHCGHIEATDSYRTLMAKIRMLNHLTKEHPGAEYWDSVAAHMEVSYL